MDKLLRNGSFWFMGMIPFAMFGWWGSTVYFLSWLPALMLGCVNGYVFHKCPAGWSFTARGWPLAIWTIASGLMLGGLPHWLMFAAIMRNPLFILGDVVTAVLYLAGIGLYISKVKLQYLYTRLHPSSA